MSALDSYIQLQRDILQYRWSVEPKVRARHEVALRELGRVPVSEPLESYLEVMVGYMKTIWEIEQADHSNWGWNGPGWENWNPVEDMWLKRLEACEEKLSQSERDWTTRRFSEFDHSRSMDKAIRGLENETA